MAWRRPGDKPLSEPVMVRSPTHICVARPQWVNSLRPSDTCMHHQTRPSLVQIMPCCQAIIWTNASLLSIGYISQKFDSNYNDFSLQIDLNMLSASWHPFYLSLNVSVLVSALRCFKYFKYFPFTWMLHRITMVARGLATEGARTSVAMILA